MELTARDIERYSQEVKSYILEGTPLGIEALIHYTRSPDSLLDEIGGDRQARLAAKNATEEAASRHQELVAIAMRGIEHIQPMRSIHQGAVHPVMRRR